MNNFKIHCRLKFGGNIAPMTGLIMAIFALLLPGAMAYGQENRSEWNVLFIAVDDLRPNLRCYGDQMAISPNFDRLAQSGTLFTSAYCQQAVCNPSRSSVMAGLRPDQINVTNLRNNFREAIPDLVTLPQLFKQNGYSTSAIGKIYHGSQKAQDSISWTSPSLYNVSSKEKEYALLKNKTGNKEASYENAELEDDAYDDGRIALEAVGRLKEYKESGNPFFLAVGFKKPHLPFCAPKKYWDLYDNGVFRLGPEKNRPINSPSVAFHQSQELRGYADIPLQGNISEEMVDTLKHAYYASVSYVDAQLGKVLDALETLDLAKNTVVVLWGDHGFHLGEQDLWAKSTNFELDTRIPLLVLVPDAGEARGNVSEDVVEAVDIYPTLVDLCGINPKHELAGLSFRASLYGTGPGLKKAAFSQFVRPYEALFSDDYSHMGYTVRMGDWRCTAWFRAEDGAIEFTELYNLKDSNIEMENLAGKKEYEDLEAGLIKMLNDYRDQKYSALEGY